jgi:hypothetical protein
MTWLAGRTGYSLLDVWTIVHVSFWIFAGSVLWSLKVPRTAAFAGCLAVALIWEAFERVAEKEWPNHWLNPESWWNSYVSDQLTVFVGVLGIWYALDHWRTP